MSKKSILLVLCLLLAAVFTFTSCDMLRDLLFAGDTPGKEPNDGTTDPDKEKPDKPEVIYYNITIYNTTGISERYEATIASWGVKEEYFIEKGLSYQYTSLKVPRGEYSLQIWDNQSQNYWWHDGYLDQDITLYFNGNSISTKAPTTVETGIITIVNHNTGTYYVYIYNDFWNIFVGGAPLNPGDNLFKDIPLGVYMIEVYNSQWDWICQYNWFDFNGDTTFHLYGNSISS